MTTVNGRCVETTGKYLQGGARSSSATACMSTLLAAHTIPAPATARFSARLSVLRQLDVSLERFAGRRFRARSHLAQHALGVKVVEVTMNGHGADPEPAGQFVDAGTATGPTNSAISTRRCA